MMHDKAMSTDSPIPERDDDEKPYGLKPVPERWRECHALGLICVHASQIIEELGTAESLVRDIAQLAQLVKKYFGDEEIDPLLDCDIRLRDLSKSLLSRIPAILGAPETTSTGESSTVLRQEEL